MTAIHFQQLAAGAFGILALVGGLRVVLVRRMALDNDEDGEADVWYYGWRAVALGCVWIAIGAYLLAASVGIAPLSLD